MAAQAVLVLGMAFVTAAYAESAVAHAAAGTTDSHARDRARLLLLRDALAPLHVVSCSDLEQHVEPAHHVAARYGTRASTSIRDFLAQHALSPRLDRIYLDYFRFPSAYMLVAYTDFLVHMLPRLLEVGALSLDSHLVVPNLPALLRHTPIRARLLDAGHPPLPMHGQPLPVHLTIALLPAADYPLYALTDQIHATLLGGYTNPSQIAQLQADHPFARIGFTLDPTLAQAALQAFDE